MSSELKNKKKRILLKGTEKYDKISYRDKILLLKRVVIDKEQIKEVSMPLWRLPISSTSITPQLRLFSGSSKANALEWTSNLLKVYVFGSRSTRA